MKKLTILCDFGGTKAPFDVYIGEPAPNRHPLEHQSVWLTNARKGTIPQDVMDRFQKLLDLSRENKVSFEDLCVDFQSVANTESDYAQQPEPVRSR